MARRRQTRRGATLQAELPLYPLELPYQIIQEAFKHYVAEDRPKLEAPGDAADLMRPLMAGEEQECFYVLLLDTKHMLKRSVLITRGLADRSQVHAREVFRPAIENGATKVILLHNHPSGDPTPSAQDISCTRNLVSAAKIIGIEVLDHVVIGKKSASRDRDYLSFREENLI